MGGRYSRRYSGPKEHKKMSKGMMQRIGLLPNKYHAKTKEAEERRKQREEDKLDEENEVFKNKWLPWRRGKKK